MAEFSFITKNKNGMPLAIYERSKGCKWFFRFLLLTEFRSNRKDNTLFLLDEPGANLHPSTQESIIEKTFKEILKNNCCVLYTTHSPYMVDEAFFENTYIVMNKSESEISEPEIKTMPYIEYYGSYQNEKTDFAKPITDFMQIKSPKILLQKRNLLIEGVIDYYMLKLFINAFNIKLNFHIHCCSGTSSLKIKTKECINENLNYAILLDHDKNNVNKNAGYNVKKELVQQYAISNKIKLISEFEGLANIDKFEELLTQKYSKDLKKIIEFILKTENDYKNSKDKKQFIKQCLYDALRKTEKGEKIHLSNELKTDIENIINTFEKMI